MPNEEKPNKSLLLKSFVCERGDESVDSEIHQRWSKLVNDITQQRSTVYIINEWHNLRKSVTYFVQVLHHTSSINSDVAEEMEACGRKSSSVKTREKNARLDRQALSVSVTRTEGSLNEASKKWF